MMSKIFGFKIVLAGLCLLFFAGPIKAQTTTAFNFQGRLNDGGTAANSNYDFQFRLYDALAGGSFVGVNNRPNLQVIGGVFSAVLDFGMVFGTGNRFLEISVRPAGSPNAHVVLGARQQILAVPFAVQSQSSTSATTAQTAQTAVSATTAANSQLLGGIQPGEFARLNFANQGDVVGANLGANGYLSVQGNALQPLNSNGLPKVMLAVTASGAIARCYNGVTGASSGNCGITIQAGTGDYTITFPFSVTNRFWLVTNHSDPTTAASDVISTRITPLANVTQLVVVTQINGTRQNQPFHLFVF